MTKGELMKFMEPFTDDIEIIVEDRYRRHWYSIAKPTYVVKVDGEGCILLLETEEGRK